MRVKKAKITFILFFYIFTLCQKALAKFNISESHLHNGISIVLVQMPGQSAVSIRMIVRAGANEQELLKSGVAHYLEHLMFQDSRYKAALQEFQKRSPSHTNALTGYDRTVFTYDRVPNEKLLDLLKIEALRFHGINMENSVAQKELSVVIDEISMIKKNVQTKAIFEVITIMFRGEKYSIPLGGIDAELKSLTLQDAQDFYKKNYIPQNITILIVGDFDKASVLAELEKLFGDLKAPHKNLSAKEAKPIGNDRKSYLQVSNKQPATSAFAIWKNGPSLSSSVDEFLAFGIIMKALNGKNSALYKHFVQNKKLANQIQMDLVGVSGEYTCPFIKAELKKGIDVYTFEKELDEFLQHLSETGITEEQFSIAQKGAYYDFIYQSEDPAEIASEIAELIICGCAVEKYNDYVNIFDSLTIRYINKVFRKCLTKSPDMILVVKGE